MVDKNTINSLVALDLDGLYVPWLTKTGTLSANLEWNQYTIIRLRQEPGVLLLC